MDEMRKTRNRLLAEKVIKGLASRHMTGYYAETKEEALAKALELIPEGASVSWGGAKSAGEIGLPVTKMGINLPCGSVARWTPK